jgi:predicted ATP-grasp superfamily ATP-dependent carboligase
MMSGYYGPESECVVGFTGQKRRENKPGAGFTTLGVCVRNQEVESATNDFMKAIGYRGIVDAEWRYDARDRCYKLLDVNPRVGAQFRTFTGTNGLDVVRGLYLDLTGKPVQSALPDQGRTWMVEPYDVIAAFRYWRRRELTLPEWLRSLRGIHETAWFARDDPTPFWVMCVRFCWEMSRRAVAARRARARNQSRA